MRNNLRNDPSRRIKLQQLNINFRLRLKSLSIIIYRLNELIFQKLQTIKYLYLRKF